MLYTFHFVRKYPGFFCSVHNFYWIFFCLPKLTMPQTNEWIYTFNDLILNTIIYPKWLTFMASNFDCSLPRNDTKEYCIMGVIYHCTYSTRNVVNAYIETDRGGESDCSFWYQIAVPFAQKLPRKCAQCTSQISSCIRYKISRLALKRLILLLNTCGNWWCLVSPSLFVICLNRQMK